MNEDAVDIDCEKHGKNVAAVICCHLVNNTGAALGFIENSFTSGDLQGWCYACEHMFLQENERTERFKTFSNSAIVCEQCYAATKKHHETNT